MYPHTIKLSFHGLLHSLSKSGIMLSGGLRTVPGTVRRLNLIVFNANISDRGFSFNVSKPLPLLIIDLTCLPRSNPVHGFILVPVT